MRKMIQMNSVFPNFTANIKLFINNNKLTLKLYYNYQELSILKINVINKTKLLSFSTRNLNKEHSIMKKYTNIPIK
jgi:hypothetical protein